MTDDDINWIHWWVKGKDLPVVIPRKSAITFEEAKKWLEGLENKKENPRDK